MKRGFTLMELLVVIMIIGLLATLGGANYLNSVRRGRNAARVQDVKAIADAQEMYFGLMNRYSDISTGNCSTTSDLLTVTKALPAMPTDPQNNAYQCTMDGTDAYCIRAALENPLNGANCSACSCSAGDCAVVTTGTLESYCVKNSQ